MCSNRVCDQSRPHPGNGTERKEAGLLGPTKSQLGRNLGWTRTSWLQLGPREPVGPDIAANMQVLSVPHWVLKIGWGWAYLALGSRQRGPLSCAQLEHKLAPMGQVRLKFGHGSWSQFWHATTWYLLRQLHTKLGSTETHHGSIASNEASWIAKSFGKHLRKQALWGFWIGPATDPYFEIIWTSTWAEVAPKWVQILVTWRHLGAKVSEAGGLPQYRALFGGLLHRKWFLKLYQSDRSVCSHSSLLN